MRIQGLGLEFELCCEFFWEFVNFVKIHAFLGVDFL